MAMTPRTLAEIREDLVAALSVSDPEINTADGGSAWKLANAEAYIAAELQARDLELSRATLPSTATGSDLDQHATVWLGSANGRHSATQWEGTVTVTRNDLVVTPVVAIGTVMTANDGTQYETTEVVNAADWLSSLTHVVAAESSGAVGTVANKPATTPLTVSAPPAGLSTSATITATTVSAEDEEDDESLRARILEVTSGRPGAGNASDYVTWATAVSGVYGAFTYPRYDGIGTVTVVGLGPPRERVLAGGVVTAIQTAIDAERPCGCLATAEAAVGILTGFAATIRVATGYTPGWPRTAVPTYTTSAAAHTSTRVYVTANPTTGNNIQVGDWIVVPIGANAYTCCRQVSNVQATYIDVATPFVTELGVETPPLAAGGDTVEPGTPNHEAIMDALFDLFDSLGPAGCSTSGRERYPAIATSWCPHLYLSDLYAAVEGVEGVVSLDITTPPMNITNLVAAGAANINLLVLNPHTTITWAAV
jgi:uncharacterized phage protein gp47/JayE